MGNVKAKEKVRRHPPLGDATLPLRRFYEAETEIIIHAVRHQARKPFRDARRRLSPQLSTECLLLSNDYTGISLIPSDIPRTAAVRFEELWR